MGNVPGMMLAFSPTIMTSSLRTNTGLYISWIMVILIVYDFIKDKITNPEKSIGIGILACGITLNIIQIIRHIILWG